MAVALPEEYFIALFTFAIQLILKNGIVSVLSVRHISRSSKIYRQRNTLSISSLKILYINSLTLSACLPA